MRIDGHQHFWKADRGDYHWMSLSVPVLCRDYLPGDLLPHLARHGIARTILVQAAQTVAETDYLLELAAQNSFIAGVVGWLDMESVDFPRQFEFIAKTPGSLVCVPCYKTLPTPPGLYVPRS